MQRSDTIPAFVDLNVLPPEHRPWQLPPLQALALLVLVVAGLAIIPLFQAQRAADSETSRLRAELDVMGYNLALVQVDIGKVRGLQRQLEAAEADLASLNEQRREVLGDGQVLSDGLAAAVLALPPGVSLDSVTGAEGLLSLSGQAPGPREVLDYAKVLETGGGFSEARVISLADDGAAEGSSIRFTIEAVQRP